LASDSKIITDQYMFYTVNEGKFIPLTDLHPLGVKSELSMYDFILRRL